MKRLYSLKIVPKINTKSIFRFNTKWRLVEGHKQSTQPRYFFGELGEGVSKYSKVYAELVVSPRLAQRYAKAYGKKIDPVTEGNYEDGFYIHQ